MKENQHNLTKEHHWGVQETEERSDCLYMINSVWKSYEVQGTINDQGFTLTYDT